MAKPSTVPILTQIRNPTSIAEQIAALRTLKNEVIGHPQKKEMWVRLGILEPIVQVMSGKIHGSQNGKRQQEETATPSVMSEEEILRLEAITVIGSLAHGGPAFLAPLHAVSSLPAILSNLFPSSNPPQIVMSALWALSKLTESAFLTAEHEKNISLLADSLFMQPYVSALCRVLSQSSWSTCVQTQLSLAVSLIGRLCREERHRSSLADAGILDALSRRLAGVIISQGLVIPGAEVGTHIDGDLDHFPTPAPRTIDFARILEAIGAIISDSKVRAYRFMYSDALKTIFPTSSVVDFSPSESTKAAWSIFTSADLATRQKILNAVEYLIPYVPFSNTRNPSAHASAFPPLGTNGSFEHLAQLGRAKPPIWAQPQVQELESVSGRVSYTDSDEPESPLIAYLIWLARSSKGLERLMAAYVLTLLYRANLTDQWRETSLGLLIVPLLVDLLGDDFGSTLNATDQQSGILNRSLQEHTPAILAVLLVDSEYLQKAAYDAGIVKKLVSLIKASYEPVPENLETRTWIPNTPPLADTEYTACSLSTRLGPVGFSPALMHNIKVREGTLRAIAALVPFKDEYRKGLIDQGIVPYIVESLKTHPDKPSIKVMEKSDKPLQLSSDERLNAKPGYGLNPVSVLIAACGAVRHLSRSVSILRTTLIDNGVVMPIFNLLKHPDIDVQIAATAAVCNLVMDFSPMRETIAAAGVLQILCQHAHSVNVKLRLNALWALKHLVQSAGNDVKKTCLEELGQGWLVQLICDDTEDEALYDSTSRSTAFISNEQSQDVQMDHEDDSYKPSSNTTRANVFSNATDFSHSLSESRNVNSFRSSNFSMDIRSPTLRELETNRGRHARKDDIAVQEQGLDFIRNLIGGYNNVGTAETSEMIDFLFNALGQDQMFEILASKLRPKVLNPFNKHRSANPASNRETRVLPPQPEIIAAVEYILVHIAASVPRHRQLVIAQTELLRLLLPQFSHPNKEVRLALCWLVINLTWVDDTHDNLSCTQRALELKRLGFLTKLEALEQDCELDVRERAKTAVWQMKQGYQ